MKPTRFFRQVFNLNPRRMSRQDALLFALIPVAMLGQTALFLSQVYFGPKDAYAGTALAAEIEPKNPFDTLDGTGPSRMNVRVIDWAGNLELQISPMGKVKTLGFKIDRETDKKKPVLVIEYQWKHLPYRQIRRALLTMPLKEGFKVYYDASYGDRDRYILTNHTPETKGWIAFTPGAEPTQIWPDHHDNLKSKEEKKEAVAEKSETGSAFEPFSTDSRPKRPVARDVGADRPQTYGDRKAPGVQFQQGQVEQDQQGTKRRRWKSDSADEDSGLSQGFDF